MNSTRPTRKQAGLTIVEVAVVMAVLSLISGVALPKISSYQSAQRIQALTALRGSVAAAAAISHSSALAQIKQGAPQTCAVNGASVGLSADGHGTLCTEAHTLVAMNHAYPSASAQGIVAAADIDAREGEVLVANNAVTVRLVGSRSPESCQFTYTAATAEHTVPSLSAATTSGC